MSERITGSYENALYRSMYTLLYFAIHPHCRSLPFTFTLYTTCPHNFRTCLHGDPFSMQASIIVYNWLADATVICRNEIF